MLPLSFSSQLDAYKTKGYALNDVATRWNHLSTAYREKKGCYTQTKGDHMAYIMARMPATYAACQAVLEEAMGRGLPVPQSALDIGAGPGTMGWALSQLPQGADITLSQVEQDPEFITFCNLIRAPLKAIHNHKSFLGNTCLSIHDWVTMAYALCELKPAHQEAWVREAYTLAGQSLILIEPGTPVGYQTLMRARDQLIALGGYVLAPCPHQSRCPLGEDDWCHFSTRFERTQEARKLKQATLPYEDEKFSYLIVTKSPHLHSLSKGRVLRHPQPRTGHIHLDICTPDGAYKRTTISAKTKSIYKLARSLEWGDDLPFDHPNP